MASTTDHRNLDDASLDALARAAAPSSAGDDAHLGALLATMGAQIATSPQRAVPSTGVQLPMFRVPRWVAIPVAGALALGISAAGAVTIWHGTADADFGAFVAHTVQEVPVPPGTDSGAYVDLLTDQGRAIRTTTTEEGVRGMVAYYATCTWLTAWQARHAAGDLPGAQAALEAYRRAADSPWLAALDAGGVRAHLSDVANDASTGGDLARAELAGSCAGLPLGGIE